MEAFRVRNVEKNNTRKLLLPLSGGISSTVLLHVLDTHIYGQIQRTGRSGYELVVYHVRNPDDKGSDSIVGLLNSRYSRHTFASEDFLVDGTGLNVDTDNDESSDATLGILALMNKLKEAPDASCREDLVQISLRKQIENFAYKTQCEGILWGDTTTRTAERILSETVKGRGFALPWLVKDGSRSTLAASYFPMNQLLRKELLPYGELMSLAVTSSSSGATTSTNTQATLDTATQEYFRSVEESYPSIVSNVVRTTAKLHTNENESGFNCNICGFPTSDESDNAKFGNNLIICHGCAHLDTGGNT